VSTPVDAPQHRPAAAGDGAAPAIYGRYFGLRHEPFSIAPDPRYLYMSERHREALAHLLYGVRGGGGFVLLTGEIGAGKTTVCRCFLEQVPPDVTVGYVFNPRQNVEELLESICEEFRIPLPAAPRRGTKPLVDALNQFLLQAHAQGRSSVLIIDEAQNLGVEVLEQLRLLTNLETSQRKLLQIILIGQPELRDMLDRPALEQLAQRVIARYHLQALDAEDTARYIRHRLSISGIGAVQPFGPAAVARIHEISRGVPRRINLLCDRALLGAYAQDRASVDVGMVEQAAAEVFGRPSALAQRRALGEERRQMAVLVGAGVLLGLAASAMGVWWVARRTAGAPGEPASRP
jgi:general secretion pathway protein A